MKDHLQRRKPGASAVSAATIRFGSDSSCYSYSRWHIQLRRSCALEQLGDQRLRLLVRDAKLAEGERALAVVEHGFLVFEGRQVGAAPEQADGDFIAPLIAAVDGLVA